jgi:hypothetical protein
LQNLESQPLNCLKNDPRPAIGGLVCGDGVVDENEECDQGIQTIVKLKRTITKQGQKMDHPALAVGRAS